MGTLGARSAAPPGSALTVTHPVPLLFSPMPQPLPARRTRTFRESVIRGMSRLAARYDAINLAQGFPDFPAPDLLKEAAVRALRADLNQYAITWGARRLREAVAGKYRRWYGMEVDPETEVTVTCGATEAMIATLLALVDPGDEVIVFEPFYENYGPDTILCDAVPVYLPLMPGAPLDLDRLAAAFSPRTRAIVVNTPANPSGRVLTRIELEAIAELCRRHDACAVTDEIYEHIRYEGDHVPIATLPGMRERTVTISGASKTFSITGWRIGTVVASPDLTDAIRKVHDFLTVGAPAPLQEGLAVALETLGPAYYAGLATDYRRRRDRLHTALVDAGFRCERPQGAYYILADFSGLSDLDDTGFAEWLARERGVAPVPGSSFFSRPELGRRYVRFVFCKTDELLEEAAARLAGGGGRNARDLQR
ncbi:MAG TPA: aminotransferase class I/II-fold pyridoxal phosphate-dependent enzyme, partial [Gemmatimonadales bacterium]|nr:aminotransferase class I/II-fold pyridoxal phosphate-dependent enzyme [Gemmatimonadales bacterium]